MSNSTKHVNRLACKISPGDILNNKYKVEAKIGRGAFCDVWRVKSLRTNSEYAAKIFRRGKLYQEHYDNELSILKELSAKPDLPPQICRLIDQFAVMTFDDKKRRSSSHLCLVVELLGDPISKALEHIDAGLPLDTVKNIMREICQGLAYLHANKIIHCDLSLGNLLLTKPIDQIDSNDDMHIVISDFNSSSRINDIFYDRAGTREYKAPEVIVAQDFDEKADIWSLGCCFYELLCDSYLFDFDESSEQSSKEGGGESDCSDSECECKYKSCGDDDSCEQCSECSHSEMSVDDPSKVSRSPPNSYFEQSDSSDSQQEWNEDYQHLMMIEQLLGKAPRKVYGGSGNKRKYFDNRGNLVHNPDLTQTDLAQILMDDFEYTADEASEIVEFLMLMIKWDPAERASAKELLESKFLAQ